MFFDLPPDPPKFWLPPKPAIIRSVSEYRALEAMNRKRRRAVAPNIIIGAVGTPYTSSANAATYTATGLPSVGASERGVILIGGRDSTTRAITSVTIGGQAAVELHHQDSSGSTAALYIGPVGASGDVVVNVATGWLRISVALLPCQNIQSATPTDTGGSTADPATDTMNCSAGGAIFGVVIWANGVTTTWTGISELYDHSPEAGIQVSGAALAFTAVQSGLTVTATPASSPGLTAMALAALR